MSSLLLIDDDEGISLVLREFFEGKGFDFLNAKTGEEGIKIAIKELPDIILLDLNLPDLKGMSILKEVKSLYPDIGFIVLTGYGGLDEAIEAIKLGAEHYFQKPVDLDELSIIVDRCLSTKRLRQEILSSKSPIPLIGRSRYIQGMFHIINLLAENPSTTVLISGETGTGKEVVARNIHLLSRRSDKPFVDINCASIPENIFESELFGHEAGAFTDAKTSRKGLLEIADGGTVFLDEVSEMPLSLQAKLLRFLETRTFRRVGGTRDIRVDVRIIAATNRDLGKSVREGLFRDDLYYRLNVMPVNIIPLRERPEDIPLLAEYFLDETVRNLNKRPLSIEREAMDVLISYAWPGNIRELRNIIERAVILCQGHVITKENLLLKQEVKTEYEPLLTLKDVERLHIHRVLRYTGNNKTKAAQILGISRSTLNEKIKEYNLTDF